MPHKLVVSIVTVTFLLTLSTFAYSASSGNVANLQQRISNIQQKLLSKKRLRIIVGLQDQSVKSLSINKNIRGRVALASRRVAITALQEKLLLKLPAVAIKKSKRFTNIPFIALEVDQNTLNLLQQSSLIASVTEDYIVPPALSSSVSQIGGDNAWQIDYSGKGQAVAVLDTGADTSHPMLAGKLVAEACFGTTSTFNNSTPFCPNALESQVGEGAGINCDNSIAQCFHGTHVAGIAVGNSDIEKGVAKDANLIAVQVFSKFVDSVDNDNLCTNSTGASTCAKSYTSDQTMALEWVFSQRDNFNIAAVNISLGGGRFTSEDLCDESHAAMKAAIDNLRSVNIATIIASGNNGYTDALTGPGCISTAISVGAVSGSDVIAGFSNSAPFLDLLAPGVGIISSEPGGIYGKQSGTSMATPHVAGAWAVLKSQIPEFTVDQVYFALANTGPVITDLRNLLNPVETTRIQLDKSTNAFSKVKPGMNLFGMGVAPELIPTTFDLLADLGTNVQVNRVERFDSFQHAQAPFTTLFETARYDGPGITVGDSAAITPGEAYIIYANEPFIYRNNLETRLCGPIQLWAGFNIANIGCAPVGMSSFDLILQLGDAVNVASIQTFDEKTGRLLTTTYVNGEPTGVNFFIKPTQSLIINARNDIQVTIQ